MKNATWIMQSRQEIFEVSLDELDDTCKQRRAFSLWCSCTWSLALMNNKQGLCQ